MKISWSKVRYLQGAIALIATITCLGRPDYNLPLFAFLFWKFDTVAEFRKPKHYAYIYAFITITCAQDVAYLVYWPSKWFSTSWMMVTEDLYMLHLVVFGASVLNLLLKVVVLLCLFAPNKFSGCFSKDDRYEEYEVVEYHQVPPAPKGESWI